MENTPHHDIHPAFAGDFTDTDARALEKALGSFLSRLPHSPIHGPEDIHVTFGAKIAGVTGNHLQPGQVTMAIDFPPDRVGISQKYILQGAMEGAYTAKRHLHPEMAPHFSGHRDYQLHLTFDDASYVKEFFSPLSRLPIFQNTEIAR